MTKQAMTATLEVPEAPAAEQDKPRRRAVPAARRLLSWPSYRYGTACSTPRWLRRCRWAGPRSLRAIEYALAHDNAVFIVAQRDAEKDEVEPTDSTASAPRR